VTTTATATTTTYNIDKAHSEVTFQVRHLLTRVADVSRTSMERLSTTNSSRKIRP
jgi:polyisoprenoid-binding protein YceI